MNKVSFIKIITFTSLALGLMFWTSCGGGKKIAKDKSTPVDIPVKPSEDYTKWYHNIFEYKTFSGKVKMKFEGKGQSQNFTTNLKMQKNEKIWASIVAMGIAEVARAQITPDKLQAVERINRNAYDMTFEEGIQKLNAPITFDMLENLLIGNPVLQNIKKVQLKVNDTNVELTVEKDGFSQTMTYDKSKQTLLKQFIKSDAKKFECTIDYSDYVVVDGQNFAKTRNIKIVDNAKNENINLSMDFTSYELNGNVEFSFSIPNNYKKKSL